MPPHVHVRARLCRADATGKRPDDSSDSNDDEQIRSPMLVVAADIGRPLRPPVRVSLDQADELLIGRADRLGRAAIVRDRRAYLALDDGSVSRGHSRIVRRPHAWELFDPASTNGTIVNGALAR